MFTIGTEVSYKGLKGEVIDIQEDSGLRLYKIAVYSGRGFNPTFYLHRPEEWVKNNLR